MTSSTTVPLLQAKVAADVFQEVWKSLQPVHQYSEALSPETLDAMAANQHKDFSVHMMQAYIQTIANGGQPPLYKWVLPCLTCPSTRCCRPWPALDSCYSYTGHHMPGVRFSGSRAPHACPVTAFHHDFPPTEPSFASNREEKPMTIRAPYA